MLEGVYSVMRTRMGGFKDCEASMGVGRFFVRAVNRIDPRGGSFSFCSFYGSRIILGIQS